MLLVSASQKLISSMSKLKTIDKFFKRKDTNVPGSSCETSNNIITSPHEQEQCEPKRPRLRLEEMDSFHIESDPGLRPMIWEIPVNQRDEIRHAYLKRGPCQPILKKYPLSDDDHPRRFNASWFELYPSWLEYSHEKDAIFCLPCYLFGKKASNRPGSNAFIEKGFNTWKKVNSGENCPLLNHVGKKPNSPHIIAIQSCEALLARARHIDLFIKKQTSEEIERNRLRLGATIDCVRWLAFQACAFRGHDESISSKNRGNFLEMLKLLGSYNDELYKVVLKNAPQVAKYTSNDVQKEILHILANMVRNQIRKEVGNAKFCIIIDEARDESKKEQMAIILRFVDGDGFIQERFFDIVHVSDTSAMTLKKELLSVLSRYNLEVENIRGQGYDGASNMRGEWNGLQALVLNDCLYAYYVHCYAHRLQLALVAASREVVHIHEFFTQLTFIVNIVSASSKRHDQLQAAQAINIIDMIANDELQTGKGANQVGTLQRAGDTRWSSHFQSICSLMKMYNAVYSVVTNIIDAGSTYSQRGDASSASKILSSFEFIFILHVMSEIMGITNILCQALQSRSQDILNAMHLVSTTKSLLQQLRNDGWSDLLENVKKYCLKHEIEIPDMGAQYVLGRGRSRQPNVTMEHHCRVDIFLVVIDSQLHELNLRFNEQTLELLTLSAALNPSNNYKEFNADNICRLAESFYSHDFTEQERLHLRLQLRHYVLDIPQHQAFQDITTLSELCQKLAEMGKSKIYHLIDRLIRLILTLPVSTATTERAFSAMKIVKTRLRNKMDDGFLANSLVINIEKDIASQFSTKTIIDEFAAFKRRRVQLS